MIQVAHIWALTRENLSSGVCERHRRRSATVGGGGGGGFTCASSYKDSSTICIHNEDYVFCRVLTCPAVSKSPNIRGLLQTERLTETRKKIVGPTHKILVLVTSASSQDSQSHINGRLLDQVVILFNCVPFHNGNFSLRKEFAPKGSEFFPLRAAPYDMEPRNPFWIHHW